MSIRHALLGLLAEEPMSGYDIAKRFEHSLSRIWSARSNQIYTELNKLADAGLIALHGEAARGRKLYAITEAGRTTLHDWLVAGPRDVDRGMRFDPLLRMNFLWLLDEKDRHAVLDRERQHYRDAAADLEAKIASLPTDDPDGSVAARRMAALIGLDMYKVIIDRIGKAIDGL